MVRAPSSTIMGDHNDQLRVALLWHSANSANLGVGALTVSQLAILREVALSEGITIEFQIVGWSDIGSAYISDEDVSVSGLRLKDFIPVVGRLRRLLKSCDVIIDIGAGDSFTDLYGSHRFLTQLVSKVIAVSTRVPLLLAPQTVGPFENRLAARMAAWTMDRARVVVTRDEQSTKYVRQLKVRAPTVEATDVAMALPFTSATAMNSGLIRIGMNVSGLLMSGGYSGDNMFSLGIDYSDFVRKAIASTLADGRFQLHLIPHVVPADGGLEDDVAVANKLQSEFPAAIVAPRFGSPSEAKSYISTMDGFSGARMHACIAAFSSGVPVLPIAYSRKFEGLFASLGYTPLVDCRSDATSEALMKYEAFLNDLDSVREDVIAAHRQVRDRLDIYRQIVATVFAEVVK